MESVVIFEVGFTDAGKADGLEVAAAVALNEGDTELDAASEISKAIPDAFFVTFSVGAKVGLALFVGLLLDLCSFASLGFSDFFA